MSEEKKDWNVYYSKPKDEPESDPQQETLPDIPISKKNRTDPDAAYSNDYAGDLGDDGIYANKFSRFWLKKKKRNLKILLVAVLLILLGLIIAFILIVNEKLGMIDYDSGVNFEHADQTHVVQEEDPVFTPMYDVADASSLKDWLKKWATNSGQKLKTKNVINCLLCGVDTEVGSEGRTDAMILVSLNKKTKKITLVSFMRDSYTYMNIDGRDRWYKINATYNWGGAATLVETIENNYKIEIDNYVTVDFDTFPKLINALGGVEVDVEEYEARYIRRTSSHGKFPYGKGVKLNGDQALIYSRIRKSDADGDVSRTRRQRKIVTALMKKAKSASVGQLNNMLNLVLPYVQTNYRRSQIFSLGTQALMQNWINYDMEQVSCPLLDINEDGSVEMTGKDSYMMTGYGSAQEFVWIVDYQLDARRVQQALYGMTNIEINEDARESPFDWLSGYDRSYDYDDDYDDDYDYDDEDYDDEESEEEPQPESTTRFIDRFFNPFDRDDDSRDEDEETPQDNEDSQNSFEDSEDEPQEEGVFTD
ncbi:MAG: LCP family protein [Clostridia bacterium]|nr:LCP family protein [Clostridia bacterium]